MAFEVPPLPYDYAALEPTIDEQTMRLHHDKHHQAYVDNANAALAGTQWADRPVEKVLLELARLPVPDVVLEAATHLRPLWNEPRVDSARFFAAA